MNTVLGLWLPEDVSTHGYQVDRLIDLLHYFMGVLFVGWGLFFAYCLVRFRSRPDRGAGYEPIKAKSSKYAEIGVVIFEAVLLLGFSMPAWARYKNEPPPRDEAFEVRVIAQQFAWNIHYAGPDGTFGRTRPELIDTNTNPIGLDPQDPTSKDDVVSINILGIPAGKPIIVRLTSQDVIHSFFIPVMRVKQDAIPGMEIPIWFTAKPDASGEYDIQCAQLCGLGHYRMRGTLKILSQEEFDAWYADAGAEEEEFLEEDEEDEDQ